MPFARCPADYRRIRNSCHNVAELLSIHGKPPYPAKKNAGRCSSERFKSPSYAQVRSMGSTFSMLAIELSLATSQIITTRKCGDCTRGEGHHNNTCAWSPATCVLQGIGGLSFSKNTLSKQRLNIWRVARSTS